MAAPLCEIVFDNQCDTFYCGSHITGHVKINLLKEKKVRSIIIKFLGEAKIKRDEISSSTTADGKGQMNLNSSSGHEIYLRHKQYLVGDKNSSLIILPPGEYVYPISCFIPPTVPCSFEGKYGHVRYTAKAILDRPWKFDEGSNLPFTVLSRLNLNHNRALMQPLYFSVEKTFCCFFCRSGPLTVTVHLPSTGFVPGQIVPIVVDIDNASNVNVDRVRIHLRQNTTFKFSSPKYDIKKSSNTISKEKFGPVAKRSSHNQIVNVTVPPTPPSYLLYCSLIDLDYSLQVECRVSGMHDFLQGEIPVIIGTVPLTMASIPPISSATSASHEEPVCRANIADQSSLEHFQLANEQSAPPNPVFPMTQQQQPIGSTRRRSC